MEVIAPKDHVGPCALAQIGKSCPWQRLLHNMLLCRRMEIITPKDYVGALIELSQQRRGEFIDMKYMTEARTTLVYDMPLAEVRR